MITTVAHAVAHAEVLGLCLREQLVTHAAHFKFQSLANYLISYLFPGVSDQVQLHIDIERRT